MFLPVGGSSLTYWTAKDCVGVWEPVGVGIGTHLIPIFSLPWRVTFTHCSILQKLFLRRHSFLTLFAPRRPRHFIEHFLNILPIRDFLRRLMRWTTEWTIAPGETTRLIGLASIVVVTANIKARKMRALNFMLYEMSCFLTEFRIEYSIVLNTSRMYKGHLGIPLKELWRFLRSLIKMFYWK